MTITNIPRTARIDPLQNEKNAVAAYGDAITPEMVTALTRALSGMHKNKTGYADDRGPTASKHYLQGHKSAMTLAEGMLISALLEPGQIFADLLNQWSHDGACNRAIAILYHLQSATDHGVWPCHG